MDKLTHFNALRAAARVAFGVVVLGGCGGAATEGGTTASESGINEADDASEPKAANEAPCPSKTDAGAAADAAPPKPSCESVLASAFPDGGAGFMEDPAQVSDEVKTCCVEHLTSGSAETWALEYRWSCCGVLDNWNNPDPQIAMACTPWGPPVPPSMKRRVRAAAMGVA